MKTKNYTLIVILLLSSIITEQSWAQDCAISTAQIDMVTPRAKIRHLPSGSMWWDGLDGKFVIEDPRLSDGPVTTGFAGGFWVGGLDDGANLKLAANTYGQGFGVTDWWPGPISEDGMTMYCEEFDNVWEIQKANLDPFLADFNDNGVIDNSIHPSILAWPGRNNPYSMEWNGFSLPEDTDLAPFFDQNQDGVYDPQQGDYPFTKGAEAAHWWIFNDRGNVHLSSNSHVILLEVSVLAYHFDTDPLGNTTIFYEYELTNKSVEPIGDLYCGIWLDADLGCFEDDLIGCSPEDNMAYVYNADEVDGNDDCACQGGVASFCNGIPLFGLKVLQGVEDENGSETGMSSFIYYNNAAVGGPWAPETTDPQAAEEYYSYVQGLWRDNTPITKGGTGYNPGSTDVTKYVYPDPPNDPNGWSQCTDDPALSDRRMIMSTGPSRKLFSGEKNKFVFSAIVTGPVAHPCPDITELVDAGNDAQEVFDGLPTSINNKTVSTPLLVSPNPAQAFVNIAVEDNQLIESIILMNSNGQIVHHLNNINQAQYQLSRNDLPVGFYFLEVQTSNGRTGVEKIILGEF